MKTAVENLLTPELKEMVWEHYQLTKNRFESMEQYVEVLIDNIFKSQKLHQDDDY